MKVEIKFKEKVGSRSGWKKVRCNHCNLTVIPRLNSKYGARAVQEALNTC